jgi:hypothetical protein
MQRYRSEMHILYNIVQRYEDQIAMNILTELDKVIKECEHNVVKKYLEVLYQYRELLPKELVLKLGMPYKCMSRL